MANANNKIVLHFHPHDLEQKLPAEFSNFRQEVVETLNKCFDQKEVKIEQIVIRLEQNTHAGQQTYSCKISLDSPTQGADFVHAEEGKEYIPIIRESCKKLVDFVFHLKAKIAEKRK